MGVKLGTQNALQGREPKTAVLSVRIEPAKKQQMVDAAAASGLSITQFIEQLLAEYLAR